MKIKKVLSLIPLGIAGVWHFIWGNIAVLLLYDQKVRKARDFRGRFLGIGKRGWKWAIFDFRARLLLGCNRGVRFPISQNNSIICPKNVVFDYDDLEIFRGNGKFFQANGGKIVIGKGTWIANNVGIITANHDQKNLNSLKDNSNVVIGERCWIGMNCVILPGTVLGEGTIVGAGSVVKGDFSCGHCLVAGSPAVIKKKYDN